MAQKIYRTQIDLRVLSENLKFLFYASFGKLEKRLCLTLTYDTTAAVDSVYSIDTNGRERLFLKFKNENLIERQRLDTLTINNSDLLLEVFPNQEGIFGFNKMNGNGYGAFLSNPRYFGLGKSGALKPFKEITATKRHPIQVMLPTAKLGNMQASFDLDILSQKCNQYTETLWFKPTLDENIVVGGNTLGVQPVTQITTRPKNIKLPTTYIPLTQKDLASREVLFDYKKELLKQDCNYQSLILLDSQVYAVENDIKPITKFKGI